MGTPEILILRSWKSYLNEVAGLSSVSLLLLLVVVLLGVEFAESNGVES